MENEKKRKMDVAPLDAVLEHLDSRFMLSKTKDVLRDILSRSKELYAKCPTISRWPGITMLSDQTSLDYAILKSFFNLFLEEMGDTVIFNELMETETGRDFLDVLNALLKFLDEFPHRFSSVKRDLALIERAAISLGLVNAFFMDPPQQLVEDGTLKEIELLAIDAKSITFSFDLLELNRSVAFYTSKMQLHRADDLVSRWVYPTRRIYDTKPKPSRSYYPRTGQFGIVDHLVEYLEQLVKAKPDSVSPLKYYILRLQRKLQGLNFLLMGISELRKEEADHQKDLVQSITNLAYEAEYAIDSFLVRDIPIWYCMFWLQDILDEIESTERELKMESDLVQSIIRSIVDLEPIELKIIPIVNNTNISGYQLLEVFMHGDIKRNFPICTWCFVSSYKERKKEVLLQLIRNASYASYLRDAYKVVCTSDMTEDELERSVSRLLGRLSYFIILVDVRDIDALNDIRRVLPNNRCRSRVLLTTSSPELAVQCRNMPGGRNKLTTNDEVVGFKAEIDGMLERLTSGPSKLLIISIFGMPGQGKTTLTKKLYNDPSVVHYFDTCAWCYVSQVYEKRALLLELLGESVQFSGAILHKSDEELAAMLYKHLKGQRFLIVLDDMWSTMAWNDLRRCFPNDSNGSRIILTTRLQGLASQVQSDSVLQPLGLLSHDESWVLLEKKLFQRESCPPELLGFGREIAKSCKGLPLSIILAAGVLAKMEKRKDCWKKIAESLSSCILDDVEVHGKGIIELSYKHLPDHLKLCFLYFGAFLEDKEVSVQKLIRLWIAEGFIKHNDLKSLEDVAEDYLEDLIHRSLVTVAQEKSIGGVKSCQVHDLLRDFCLIKAAEENFLQLVRGYDELFPSSNDYPDHGFDPNYSCTSTPIMYHLRRLCIYSKKNHFIMLKPAGPTVRSLLFFASSDMSSRETYDISFISDNFKLLRILDLEMINIGDAFKAVAILVHLRFLAVQGYMDSVPASMVNLLNLETFCIKALGGKVVHVPDSIWDMTKLRHLHINEIASFDVEPHRFENLYVLDNLQTFSTPSLRYGNHMEKILRRQQGIRKLKCIFLDSWDDATNCNKFPVLGSLNQLVSLKVFYNGAGIYPCEFNFPSNLKKLTLSNFRMPWNEISQLSILRNLEALKLLGNAFEGETWDMGDEEFPKLKFLKLDTLNVETWMASRDNFPCLESLLLHNCGQLEEIPRDIGEIPSLLKIEVLWCSPTAASAKEIQDEQQDFNVGLKVNILPKVWDSASPSSG